MTKLTQIVNEEAFNRHLILLLPSDYEDYGMNFPDSVLDPKIS